MNVVIEQKRSFHRYSVALGLRGGGGGGVEVTCCGRARCLVALGIQL